MTEPFGHRYLITDIFGNARIPLSLWGQALSEMKPLAVERPARRPALESFREFR
jgi:hypothetical protein